MVDTDFLTVNVKRDAEEKTFLSDFFLTVNVKRDADEKKKSF